MAGQKASALRSVDILDKSTPHTFAVPIKRINNGDDLSHFLVSKAYRDITTFLMQLNHSMFPVSVPEKGTSGRSFRSFPLKGSGIEFTEGIFELKDLLQDLAALIEEAPPDKGPRRFGNISFRKWSELLETRANALLERRLPTTIFQFASTGVKPLEEIRAYFLGSFGSSQRLDFGTGHELSFIAFLCCIWKLGGFGAAPNEDVLRGIVIGVIQPYLSLVRKLIQTYNLEPAGSHGVWGLDDHSFLPYIFGSAQYGPPIRPDDPTPVEGSVSGAPDPGSVTDQAIVQRERDINMYFGAIGFIYDVKTGPFWEHSPTLYDISGVRAGWGKINKGMMKMYDAEVLGKFPVVQHFPFGSLFSWDRDINASPAAITAHSLSQPKNETPKPATATSSGERLSGATQAPWAMNSLRPNAALVEQTLAPRVADQRTPSHGTPANTSRVPGRPSRDAESDNSMPPPTRAPWAK